MTSPKHTDGASPTPASRPLLTHKQIQELREQFATSSGWQPLTGQPLSLSWCNRTLRDLNEIQTECRAVHHLIALIPEQELVACDNAVWSVITALRAIVDRIDDKTHQALEAAGREGAHVSPTEVQQ